MLGGEDPVRRLDPDGRALAGLLADIGAKRFAGTGTRYTTRMFGPGLGIYEDPATGSGAGPLAVHRARHGRIAFGQQIEISQGAGVGWPSTLYARVMGGPDRIDALDVGGSAVWWGRASTASRNGGSNPLISEACRASQAAAGSK